MHGAFARRRRICWPLIAAAVLCGWIPAPSLRADTWKVIEESWYVVEIDGQKAGWSAEIVEDDGRCYRTTVNQKLTISRGPNQTNTLELTTTYVETHRGDPVSASSRRLLSAEPESVTWTFEDGRVRERSDRGGRVVERTLPRPEGSWLMPRAASVFIESRRAGGAASIRCRTLDCTGELRVAAIDMTRGGQTAFDHGGRSLAVTIWTVRELGADDRVMRTYESWIAEDGVLVRTIETAGSMRFIARLSTREEAQRDWGGGPELLARTFVRPSQRIRAPHRTTSATYRLRVKEGPPPELPTIASQRVTSQDDGSLLVTITPADPVRQAPEEDAPNGGAPDPKYLAATPLIDCDDPVITDMAARLIGAIEHTGDRAEALRLGVHRHLRAGGLASAFASASEAARGGAGDCSEHAVLLAALLRARGVPARVAMGLVYAESFAGQRHIFAWHMWTQAWVDERWIDLDATIDRPFSAAHILVATSALNDGVLGDEFTRLLALMGNLEVEVVGVGYERADAK